MVSTPSSTADSFLTPVFIPRAVMALVCLGFVIWGLWDFPVARVWVWAATILYAAALWRWPHAWIVALPALLPIYDLGLWSSRFLFAEFDALVFITLARHYLRPASRPVLPPLTGWAGGLGLLLLISLVVSMLFSGRGIHTLEAANLNYYLEPVNALRVARGFVEAWLLWPLLRAAAREEQRPVERLFQGFACAAAVAGVIALWEKGIFRLLADGTGLYGLVSSILDFSGAYRVTLLFSDMHVGGTATDGFLILAVSLAFGAVLASRARWLRILCALAGAAALYATMLTFSRGLYAGAMLAILLLGIWFGRDVMKRHVGSATAGLRILPLLVAGAVFCDLAYLSGGHQAMAESLLLLAGAALVMRLEILHKSLALAVALLALAAFGGTFALHASFAGSRWSHLPQLLMWPAALVIAWANIFLGAWLGRLLRGIPPLVLGGGFVAFAAVAGIVLPAVLGTGMTQRLATSEEDLGTRQHHWDAAFDTLMHSGGAIVVGMGAGSFPSYYFTVGMDSEGLSSALLQHEGGMTFLREGVGDFAVAQRVSVKPGTVYHLTGRVRAPGDSILGIKLCPRDVLFFQRYTPECAAARVSVKGTGWQDFDVELKSGRMGHYGPLYWPPTLHLYTTTTTLDIASLALRPDGGGDTVLHNGDFSSGIDRWFIVSDYGHLAWHTKNIFLHFFFEQGLLGLAAFGGLLALGLIRSARRAWAGDARAIGLLAALAGLVVVGLFGTIVDNPPVALAAYLVLFVAADRKLAAAPRDDAAVPHSRLT